MKITLPHRLYEKYLACHSLQLDKVILYKLLLITVVSISQGLGAGEWIKWVDMCAQNKAWYIVAAYDYTHIYCLVSIAPSFYLISLHCVSLPHWNVSPKICYKKIIVEVKKYPAMIH